MNRIKLLLMAGVAAFVFTACQPVANTSVNAPAVNANANSMANANANRATAGGQPNSEALMALEKSAAEAWKNKDTKFWNGFISDRFGGLDPSGKMDKAAVLKQMAEANCEVKSYSMSDQQMKQLGPDAALITYKADQDATCGGQKVPASTWAATVYVREGSDWKAAYHGESPIAEPNAKPAAKPPANANANTAASPAAPGKADDVTAGLLDQEKKAWDAWKNKDRKGIEDWAASDLVAFTANGRQDRSGAVDYWLNDGCEVKSFSLTDPSGVALSSDYHLLLFKASVDGKCKGSPVPPEYGATVYQNQSGTWKAVFTMGTDINQ